MPIRIVLTGSPSSGKTTLLHHFKKSGFHCLSEVSREIIQHSLDNELDITPWQDLQRFSQQVYKKRLKQFHEARSGFNFFDRSLVDIAAYQVLDGQSISNSLKEKLELLRYDYVFLAEPWEQIFENDAQRIESWEKAKEIDLALKSTYQTFNYHPIIVPKGSIEERAHFVLEKIGALD
jgi:predicted ATPase